MKSKIGISEGKSEISGGKSILVLDPHGWNEPEFNSLFKVNIRAAELDIQFVIVKGF